MLNANPSSTLMLVGVKLFTEDSEPFENLQYKLALLKLFSIWE